MSMHCILFYDVVDDYLARRAEFRERHLEHARQAVERGELVLAGALADPVDGAVLIFRGPSSQAAEEFARADPYVINGLVTKWRVRRWTTVVGESGLLRTERTTASAPRPVRTVLWRWLEQGTGLERLELLREADGWLLRGTILGLAERGPAEARYAIVCDAAWRTQRVDVRVRDATAERTLRLGVEQGRWYEDGREREAVRGCVDVDLSWSPATNTLPIRRLDLAVGQRSEPVTAAWIRFPDLALEPLPQDYERLSEQRYRYTSRGGDFTAEIDVDDDGLVVDYEGLWRRVSEPR